MSHDEAVDLVLGVSAAEHTEIVAPGGAYYVDMGAPHSILALAQELIRRSGRGIEIKVTGARAGEKIRERLFDDYECVSSTPTEGLFHAAPLEANSCLSDVELDEVERIAHQFDDSALVHHLFALLDRKLGRRARLAG